VDLSRPRLAGAGAVAPLLQSQGGCTNVTAAFRVCASQAARPEAALRGAHLMAMTRTAPPGGQRLPFIPLQVSPTQFVAIYHRLLSGQLTGILYVHHQDNRRHTTSL
jgi:hypothetical protein